MVRPRARIWWCDSLCTRTRAGPDAECTGAQLEFRPTSTTHLHAHIDCVTYTTTGKHPTRQYRQSTLFQQGKSTSFEGGRSHRARAAKQHRKQHSEEMDVVLNAADSYVLDSLYAQYKPEWGRDALPRQAISVSGHPCSTGERSEPVQQSVAYSVTTWHGHVWPCCLSQPAKLARLLRFRRRQRAGASILYGQMY